MEKQSFTINYYGKNVACSKEDNHFMVQISYIPFYLDHVEKEPGNRIWIEKERQSETQLSKEIGALIEQQFPAIVK